MAEQCHTYHYRHHWSTDHSGLTLVVLKSWEEPENKLGWLAYNYSELIHILATAYHIIVNQLDKQITNSTTP